MDNNIIDSKCSEIIECAHIIFELNDKYENAKSNIRKNKIVSSIEHYKTFIDSQTNNSFEDVLRRVEKIDDLKMKLESEQNPEKRKMLESAIETNANFIKSRISDEALIEEDDKVSDEDVNLDKAAQYRASQKYDLNLLRRTRDLSQMCETHRAELKTAEEERKEVSRKTIINVVNNEYFKL